MILFDGLTYAHKKELQLQAKVAELKANGIQISIAAILFREDSGSVLYTNLKREAAQRVGIGYQVAEFSMRDPLTSIIEKIHQLNVDPTITGIIIQKPWRKRWEEIVGDRGSMIEFTRQTFVADKQKKLVEDQGQENTSSSSLQASEANQTLNTNHQSPNFPNTELSFPAWWSQLTSAINEQKDVDGLHPNTLKAIKLNTWRQENRVLPATCKAVLDILNFAFYHSPNTDFRTEPVAIIGKSDLLGTPLFYELRNQRYQKVKLLGRKALTDLKHIGVGLKDFTVIVSSTGQKNLISGEMIREGSFVIDVGEPQGDVERSTVQPKVKFLTPVPGGVGPMTIVCLLENGVELAELHNFSNI